MQKTGLVLEGGGIRGIYTAGVLDYFMDQNFQVDCVIGVSAGALHGVNYKAKQPGRSYRVATDYIKDKRYLSFHSLVRTGDIFGSEFCYHTIPEELDLFDYETFQSNPMQLYATVSNVATGKAEYKLCTDLRKDMDYIRASASLPLLSRVVEIDGERYLDGGICDSIPLKQSQAMGYTKNIVILTRVAGYVKKLDRLLPMIRRKYRNDPEFVQAAYERHLMYNETIQFVEEQEKEGNCFVLRPSRYIEVSRLEKNVSKIKSLYQLGFLDAKEQWQRMVAYMER